MGYDEMRSVTMSCESLPVGHISLPSSVAKQQVQHQQQQREQQQQDRRQQCIPGTAILKGFGEPEVVTIDQLAACNLRRALPPGGVSEVDAGD